MTRRFPQSAGGAGSAPDPRATGFIPNPKARLQEQVHEAMRFFHYSRRTEEAYWGWIVRFLKFHRRPLTPAATVERTKPDAARATPEASTRRVERVVAGGWRHPHEMGVGEVAEFLSHLAREGILEGVLTICT